MPRIAAALAVFLTAVTCIGFNTARYPVVWEMVASSEGSAGSQGSELPAADPQSASASQPATSPQSPPAREPQVTAEPAGGAGGKKRGVRGEPRGVSGESSPAWTEGGPIVTPDCEPADPSMVHSQVPLNGQSTTPSAQEDPMLSRADAPEDPAREELLPKPPNDRAFSGRTEWPGGPSYGEQGTRGFRSLSTASPVEQAEDKLGQETEAHTGRDDPSDRQAALVPVAPAGSKLCLQHALQTRGRIRRRGKWRAESGEWRDSLWQTQSALAPRPSPLAPAAPAESDASRRSTRLLRPPASSDRPVALSARPASRRAVREGIRDWRDGRIRSSNR